MASITYREQWEKQTPLYRYELDDCYFTCDDAQINRHCETINSTRIVWLYVQMGRLQIISVDSKHYFWQQQNVYMVQE